MCVCVLAGYFGSALWYFKDQVSCIIDVRESKVYYVLFAN